MAKCGRWIASMPVRAMPGSARSHIVVVDAAQIELGDDGGTEHRPRWLATRHRASARNGLAALPKPRARDKNTP